MVPYSIKSTAPSKTQMTKKGAKLLLKKESLGDPDPLVEASGVGSVASVYINGASTTGLHAFQGNL
jgi:hypothetical protein